MDTPPPAAATIRRLHSVSPAQQQAHRADLAKMLVHRRLRQQGLGSALLRAAEVSAQDCGKTVVVLDTMTGSTAERL